MMNIKDFIGVVAVALTFIGYAPYIRDIFNGKTKPHIFSWFTWILTTALVYALQATSGAGPGAWVTLSLVVIMSFITILSFKRGYKDIKKIDVIFFLLAILALPLWLVVKKPVLSIILLTAIDLAGFVPTIRKSWNAPRTETLSFYAITTFRHALSIFALEQFNIITALYPIAWVVANALFVFILIVRRRKIA
jgi:uncharacterized protein with PQ loop repeat